MNDVLSATRQRLRVHVLPTQVRSRLERTSVEGEHDGTSYRARVDERWYLDLPGVSSTEAYVFAFVEDTSGSDLRSDPSCDDTCSCCPDNFEPRIRFELGNGRGRFALRLWVEEPWRGQSLRALETVVSALQAIRHALMAEGDEYDRRERMLEEDRSAGS